MDLAGYLENTHQKMRRISRNTPHVVKSGAIELRSNAVASSTMTQFNFAHYRAPTENAYVQSCDAWC